MTDDSAEIDLLIGSDKYYDIVYGDIFRGVGYGPVAIASKFGYLIQGPLIYDWIKLVRISGCERSKF